MKIFTKIIGSILLQVFGSNQIIEAQNITTNSHKLLGVYTLKTPEKIGNWEGTNFFEGGFSGIAHIPGTDNEFYLINDRGPNIPISDSSNKNENIKLFPFPNYAQKLVRVKLKNEEIEILNMIPLVSPNNQAIVGLPLPVLLANDKKETAWGNLNGTEIPANIWGLDAEGIALENDSTIWIGDEYRPSLWKINAQTGKLMSITSPENSVQTQHIIPYNYAFREANKGFEAIAITPNKNIAALLQSPIKKYASKEKFNSRLSRLLMFEPNSGKSKMFAYEMNDSISGKYIDWKIGDMTAINNTQFLVLEHGKVNGKLMAEIYLIDISKASILPTNPKDKNHLIEQFIDAKTLAHKTGLIAVSKKLLLNLTDNGYQTNINKPEGITLINNQTIAIVNDNDYGIGEVDEKNTIQILDAKTHIYLFTLPEKLNFIPQY